MMIFTACLVALLSQAQSVSGLVVTPTRRLDGKHDLAVSWTGTAAAYRVVLERPAPLIALRRLTTAKRTIFSGQPNGSYHLRVEALAIIDATETRYIVLPLAAPQPPFELHGSLSALQAAITAAPPGRELVLGDGDYTMSGAIKISGKTDLVVRSNSVGGVTLKGTGGILIDNCSRVTISGFDVLATWDWNPPDHLYSIVIHGSDNVRVTRLKMHCAEPPGSYPYWVFVDSVGDGKRSEHVRIDHCEFYGKVEQGSYIVVEGDKGVAKQVVQYCQIDHNLFRDVVGFDAQGNKETIRYGSSSISSSNSGFSAIEDNLFERCDGEDEIVSIKCCELIVRRNTFRECVGALVLRHGSRSQARDNIFLGNNKPNTGGIRIFGDDHLVDGNFFGSLAGTSAKATTAIANGTVDVDGTSGANRVDRLVYSNNKIKDCEKGIQIGWNNSGAYPLPVRNVIVSGNIISLLGSAVDNLSVPASVNYSGNVLAADKPGVIPTNGYILDPGAVFNTPAGLSVSQVGPLGP